MKPINGSGTLTGSESSPWIKLNHSRKNFNVGILVGAPGGVSGNITLVYSESIDYESAPSYMQKTHFYMNNVALIPNDSLFVSLLSPCTAIKLVGNSITGGNAKYEIVQSGAIN